jgi:hypothetical protein
MNHEANILAAYRAATPADLAQGLEWYGEAARIAGELAAGRYSARTVAGVIAAMSPMMTWRSNLDVAGRLIALHAGGRKRAPAKGYGLGANVRKAWAILCGADPAEVLTGPKVRAFFANIAGDPAAVTVDRWAVRIALADPAHPGTVTAKGYRILADAYRAAAATAGVSPRELQAATWTAYRRVHGHPGADPLERAA